MHRSDPTRLQQHALLMCERIDTAVRLMGHMEDGLSRDNLGRGRNPRGQPRPGPQAQGGAEGRVYSKQTQQLWLFFTSVHGSFFFLCYL